MAKGRTNQPVTVWVADEWRKHPAIQELEAHGHAVYSFTEVASYGARFDNKVWLPDLILHPAAHGWHEAMFEQYTRKNGEPYRPFVDAAVKAGRQRRKAK